MGGYSGPDGGYLGGMRFVCGVSGEWDLAPRDTHKGGPRCIALGAQASTVRAELPRSLAEASYARFRSGVWHALMPERLAGGWSMPSHGALSAVTMTINDAGTYPIVSGYSGTATSTPSRLKSGPAIDTTQLPALSALKGT